MDPNLDWSNQLWAEWKYRHEMWGKTFYRSLGFVVTIAVIPFVKTSSFELALPANKWFRGCYAFLPLLLFGVTAFQLAYEYKHLIGVEARLKHFRGFRDTPELKMSDVFSFKGKSKGKIKGSSTMWFTTIYVVVGFLLWLAWAWAFMAGSYPLGSIQ